jgi:hypothetical protein
VKLIKATRSRLVFQMGQREEALLRRILDLYPCLPPAHQKLSKAGHLPEPEANQRLLDEALAEHRAEKKKQVQALLANKRHLSRAETTSQLSLSPAEAEAVLQVLNDVRVGSWVLLGSPEEIDVDLDEKTAPHLVAMQMAGYFEAQFLEALSGGT